MRKQLTALLTALFLLLSGAAAWADYTEWKDSSYPFSAAKTIYLDQVDTAQVENLSPVEEWKLKDTFYRKISKIKDITILIKEPKPEGHLASGTGTEDALIGQCY